VQAKCINFVAKSNVSLLLSRLFLFKLNIDSSDVAGYIVLFCCVFMMLNIGFWNVHGLNKHKSEDEDFLSYVNSYDIVGFAETLNDTPRNLPNFPHPLIIKATKRKRRGRPYHYKK
jgi:hypothetical protein